MKAPVQQPPSASRLGDQWSVADLSELDAALQLDKGREQQQLQQQRPCQHLQYARVTSMLDAQHPPSVTQCPSYAPRTPSPDSLFASPVHVCFLQPSLPCLSLCTATEEALYKQRLAVDTVEVSPRMLWELNRHQMAAQRAAQRGRAARWRSFYNRSILGMPLLHEG